MVSWAAPVAVGRTQARSLPGPVGAGCGGEIRQGQGPSLADKRFSLRQRFFWRLAWGNGHREAGSVAYEAAAQARQSQPLTRPRFCGHGRAQPGLCPSGGLSPQEGRPVPARDLPTKERPKAGP